MVGVITVAEVITTDGVEAEATTMVGDIIIVGYDQTRLSKRPPTWRPFLFDTNIPDHATEYPEYRQFQVSDLNRNETLPALIRHVADGRRRLKPGVKRKLDFGAVRAVFDPDRTTTSLFWNVSNIDQRVAAVRATIAPSSPRHRPPSVTESVVLPPDPKGEHHAIRPSRSTIQLRRNRCPSLL